MLIGERLRQLRQQRGMTRADMEQSSGLLRSFITRVELGYSIPTLETLERFAAALEVPLYWLFYAEESEGASTRPCRRASDPKPPLQLKPSDNEVRFLMKLAEATGRSVEPDPAFLVDFARQIVLGKPEN